MLLYCGDGLAVVRRRWCGAVKPRQVEPVTPTLPGAGGRPDPARQAHFGAVAVVVEGGTVVTTVVNS